MLKLPRKPVMVWDGDCGFCGRWIARWREITGDAVAYEPAQKVAEQFPEIPREEFEKTVYLIEPSGDVSRGAEAVFRVLRYSRRWKWLLPVYEKIPAVAPVSEALYGVVASHRRIFSWFTRLLWGDQTTRSTYAVTSYLFLKCLAVVYGIAFLSLWLQVEGLIGRNGILPADGFLAAVEARFGPERFFEFPTLFWIDAGDRTLNLLCGIGVGLSGLLFIGVLQRPVLLALWAIYLSFAIVGRDFLGFQWDNLLLEAGSLAIFLPRSRKASIDPSWGSIWLMRWLLFRLMFASGLVKLASGDPTWTDWTALNYHYETQPLPTWTSWYAHQLPLWFQKGSVGAMFFIELVVPFCLFLPRRVRLTGFIALVGLQVLILATGNYAFFNWLTIALCLFLLDDGYLSRWVPRRLSGKLLPDTVILPIHPGAWRSISTVLAVCLFGISAIQMGGRFFPEIRQSRIVSDVLSVVAPFRSINNYGLFAVMTTSRPEIVIEGSEDGELWKEYGFKWKPGDVQRSPGFVAPHQPRLDWQMWFAALGTYERNPWFGNFMIRLLQGSPEVLGLLEWNPFPESPPRYVRAVLYDYRFTDGETRSSAGAWWRRTYGGLYSPVLTLRPES